MTLKCTYLQQIVLRISYYFILYIITSMNKMDINVIFYFIFFLSNYIT